MPNEYHGAVLALWASAVLALWLCLHCGWCCVALVHCGWWPGLAGVRPGVQAEDVGVLGGAGEEGRAALGERRREGRLVDLAHALLISPVRACMHACTTRHEQHTTPPVITQLVPVSVACIGDPLEP